jgi:pimeloyl-ACP methyl ester carboxylesterase
MRSLTIPNMKPINKRLAAAILASLVIGGSSFGGMAQAEPAMHIEGHGPVTIVFEAGLGDTGRIWQPLQSSVADQCARSVAYTRRGYGVGSAADGPRDAEHIVAELRRQLAESRVSPPYVLVGHSLGGLYMQYFARRHPEEVQGLVLVDSMQTGQLNRVRAEMPGVFRMMNVVTAVKGGAMRREFVAIPTTAEEVEALPEPLNVPTIVLSSTRAAAGEKPAFRALLAQLQTRLAATYAARHEFIPDSGHYIQRDQPQVVINAARELAGCAITR